MREALDPAAEAAEAGDFSGYTPARLIRNLNRGDYRDLTGGRLSFGRAMLSLKLDTSGVPTECRVTSIQRRPLRR